MGRFGERPVKKDHYSILGVTPASEDAVIRSAYRTLMRRYHPDADSSAEASERAREINEAYRILGDRERRAQYDEQLKEQSPLKFEPFRAEPPRTKSSRLGPLAAIGFAALALGMVAFAVSPELRDLGSLSPSGAGTEEPRPRPRPSVVTAAAQHKIAPTEDSCSDPSANELIKAELFRRAAQLRPEEQAQFERVASHALLRIDSTSAKEPRATVTGCSGWLAIDLPRGLVVDGSRSNLNAEVAFGLVHGGKGLRLASLSGVNSLIRSLATLGPPAREPESITPTNTKEIASTRPSVRAAVEPVAAASKTVIASPKPSTVEANAGCAAASSRSERIVCASANLSSLDRQLTLLYRQSWKQADEQKRAALIGTRQRFNDRREACGTSNCMTTTYVSRLREISDIMAGKGQQ
jgi:curved DNA-binding protein CbpA/uncharacterized protein YecT (DUF1311 family)